MKRILALALAALLLLPALPVFAENTNGDSRLTNTDGFVYVVAEDGTAEIVGYTGSAKTLTIPAEIDGHAVTAIGMHAFKGNQKLTSVTVPAGVQEVKGGAFDHCSALKEVSFSEGLRSIQSTVFWQCKKLKTVRLPDSLTEMGNGVFAGCSGLKTVTLSDNHPYLALMDGVLFSKPDCRLLWYPMAKKDKSYTVPEGTQIIDGEAFIHTAVQQVTLPETVREIGKSAFYACEKLKTINIPSGVTNLTAVFPRCSSMLEINVSPDNPVFESMDGVLFQKEEKALVLYPTGRTGKSYAVPEGTRSIENEAFYGSKLTEITIPDTVRSIGGNAFLYCEKIKKIVLPEGVEELGNYAFQHCAVLTEVSFPATLTNVGANPFLYCKKVKTIELATDHPALELRDDALISTADHRLLWYSPTAKVKQYTVPEDVRIIGQEAFVNCKQLKEVTLPEGVEEIRASAFQGCTGIKSFTLPASLSLIEKTAFQKDAIKQGLIGATYTVPAGSYAEEFCRAYGLKTQTK